MSGNLYLDFKLDYAGYLNELSFYDYHRGYCYFDFAGNIHLAGGGYFDDPCDFLLNDDCAVNDLRDWCFNDACYGDGDLNSNGVAAACDERYGRECGRCARSKY